ncbi:hypothetical protein [Devosia nitrariae]|uniref:Uncharacterized protein n=1 Tax=Devosia nitrariae TaxID=2071872 RepID=A0ABQ5W6D3_9HYPH|nr:hypothetical protein [Devosia nitrariae]GLQ55506.1 hypothetical protein GCM10010862_27650 [Devosia nitrariae]
MPIERQTIITDSGGSASIIGGIIVGVVLVLVALWFFGAFDGVNRGDGASVTVDVPPVEITTPAQ